MSPSASPAAGADAGSRRGVRVLSISPGSLARAFALARSAPAIMMATPSLSPGRESESEEPRPTISIAPSAHADSATTTASVPSEPPPRPSRGRWLRPLLAIALAVTILAALACASMLAVAHARDRYKVNIAAGSWLALAWSANHGELYPALRDEQGRFAGTRYMPLYILAHAGLARATGEYLLSGRIVAYVSAAGWMLGIIALARQRGCPWLFAGALGACVMLSPVGFQALCTIRSDGLALALQLWALWFIGRGQSPPSSASERGVHTTTAIIAGILCALAFLAKLTAVWAAFAIGLWLLWRDRKALAVFIITGALLAGAALLAMHVITDGRMLENFLAAGGSGWQGWGAVAFWSPQRLLQFISDWSPTTWVLAPAALLAMLLGLAQRELNTIHLAWAACCGILLLMFADIGVGENHTLELAAITAALAADLWRRAQSIEAGVPASQRWSIAQMLLAAAVVWSSLATLTRQLKRDVSEAMAMLRSPSSPPPPHLDPHLFEEFADRKILSDDPAIDVLLSRKPVVSDAFVFRSFAHAHPEWQAELIERITSREFDAVILLKPAAPDSWWYRELFFGRDVMQAIAANYQSQRRIGEYWVYERAQ